MEQVTSMSFETKFLNKLYFIYDTESESNQVEISLDIIPESMSYSYSPNFESQNFLGRLSPIYMYRSGSAKTYSFSVKVHNDIVNDGIENFVNNIKMLSYPKKNLDMTVSLPKVYFQLGEIAGFAIVKSTINWEKPYTLSSGHYAMATISFEITVEREITPPEIKTARLSDLIIVQDESQEFQIAETGETSVNVIYEVRSQLDLSYEDAENLIETLNDQGYNFNIADFVSYRSGLIFETKQNIARESYNYQQQRLNNLFGLFASSNSYESTSDLNKFKEIVRQPYSAFFNPEDTKYNADIIKDAKNKFESYLKFYYDEVNTKLTREQYNIILDEVYVILEKMQALAEELSYGASG
jgi:hypothetical protein